MVDRIRKTARKHSVIGKCLTCNAPTYYILYAPDGCEWYSCENCLSNRWKLRKFKKRMKNNPLQPKQTILEPIPCVKIPKNEVIR